MCLCIVSRKRVDALQKTGASELMHVVGNNNQKKKQTLQCRYRYIIDVDVKKQLRMRECGCAVIRTESYVCEQASACVCVL